MNMRSCGGNFVLSLPVPVFDGLSPLFSFNLSQGLSATFLQTVGFVGSSAGSLFFACILYMRAKKQASNSSCCPYSFCFGPFDSLWMVFVRLVKHTNLVRLCLFFLFSARTRSSINTKIHFAFAFFVFDSPLFLHCNKSWRFFIAQTKTLL